MTVGHSRKYRTNLAPVSARITAAALLLFLGALPVVTGGAIGATLAGVPGGSVGALLGLLLLWLSVGLLRSVPDEAPEVVPEVKHSKRMMQQVAAKRRKQCR